MIARFTLALNLVSLLISNALIAYLAKNIKTMESSTLQPISKISGEINLPGSKSVSNRALLLAALATGTTRCTLIF